MMKKLSVIILILFVSFGLMAQNAKKFYKAGLVLAQEGRNNEAIDSYSSALALDANYIDALVARAKAYESISKLQESAQDWDRVVALDPKVVDYIFQAGKINYHLKDYNKALKYLTEVVVLDNKHFQGYQYKSFAHIKLEDYKNAIVAIDNALAIEKTYVGYYTRGVANDSLKNYIQAISDYNNSISLDPNFDKAFFALTKVYLKNSEPEKALANATKSVQKFPDSSDAYEVRSLVYYSQKDFPNAINDLSKMETLVADKDIVLYTRGLYYFEYQQYQNAKSDFSQVLTNNPENVLAIYWRARANEELMEAGQASADYERFITLAAAQLLPADYLIEAKKRNFEINREIVAPMIVIDTPLVIQNTKLAVLNNSDRIVIKGTVNDQSEIVSFTINNVPVKFNDHFSFEHQINIIGTELITIVVTDVYNNSLNLDYSLINMETDIPVVKVTTPYAGDNNEIYLGSNSPTIFIEGFVEDASNIRDIFIDSIRANFNDKELNPRFTATINIETTDVITIKAIDGFNNESITTFTLNREGANIAATNPMGKTWVIFIENSSYETFASLDGPSKDVSTMKSALVNYEVHNFIHKKDMTKKEMERFFSIELRDQVKKNNVNSLLVWYAGHGKFINETGYWIPVDAARDDEFTYFNINSLKAGMQSYSTYITHTLVVTDACESGPSFYQAMRATNETRSCDDVNATKFKSSQVFSSAGYELASDNSQFTKTFAKSLQFNENSCIPIETIVTKVTEATANNQRQKPEFGKIAGFEDENGTFFFIKK